MNKVLIIDSEMLTAKIVKEGLMLHGIESDVAEDGERGLELIREEEYDLVLLDLKMPRLSGEEVLREIRKIRPYIFVIIHSTFKESADADGYVRKGFDADLGELIGAVKWNLDLLY